MEDTLTNAELASLSIAQMDVLNLDELRELARRG